MGRLDGKLALVTGAARGLGAAIARRFRAEGAQILVNDLDPPGADKLAHELGGEALVADVSDSQAVQDLFEQVSARHGRLDVLVNNAGIGPNQLDREASDRLVERSLAQAAELASGAGIQTHLDATVEMSDERWTRMLAVHLDGTFFCCREALKLMGPALSGSIINMGSIMGTAGGAGAPAYCAAKAGILGLTRSLARELASRRIRVNALAPGYIDTEMTLGLGQLRGVIELQTPMGQLGQPDDIAWAATYLASDEARFVTGQVLSPNGGWHMSQ
ncbi:MAG: SDR family oxidoreductase [Myxococcota bacterium]|nr:SDR family oxidoreductase [Myxococcota bacterium]